MDFHRFLPILYYIIIYNISYKKKEERAFYLFLEARCVFSIKA